MGRIINHAREIKQFILKNVKANPGDIVRLAIDKFAVTSTTVHRHINALIKEGKLLKSGSTRNTRYYLQSEYNRRKEYKISSGIAEDKVFKEFEDIFLRFSKNIYDICYFGVTEMLNNAIEHSKGSIVTMQTIFKDLTLIIIINDNGLGAFKTICDALHVDDLREGIVHISKGKITRDPINHTGQGIFFTSRMFDKFIIEANNFHYEKDNMIHDWSFKQIYGLKGTQITMVINVNSGTTCKEVFLAYEGEDYAFDKTEFMIHLADFKESNFISRSQAKRVLLGMENFSSITLDFKKIEFIGQGFVDEVFRVFANKNPGIKIQYLNANESVRFMIERSLRTKN